MARSNDPHESGRLDREKTPVTLDEERSESPREPQTAAAVPATRRSAKTSAHNGPEKSVPSAHDYTMRDSFIGTDRGHRNTNTSWGAIFAGTVTFLALMLVFGMISAALGLHEVDGAAVGIWSVVAILLALTVGGFVAGALAVRGGLLHGLVTWATSLVAVVALVGWLGAGVLGAIGGALGNVAQTAVEQTDITATEVEDTVEETDVDQEDVDEAQQQAGEAAEDVQEDAAEAAWWGVAGLVLGAVLAGLAGVAGARAAHTRQAQVDADTHHRRNR